jgi:membrane glycosyltransferase
MKFETTDQIPMGSISMVSLSLLTLLLPLFVAFVGMFLMVFIGFVQINFRAQRGCCKQSRSWFTKTSRCSLLCSDLACQDLLPLA